MKKNFALVTFAAISFVANAQNYTTFSEKLDESKQAKLFTAEKNIQLGIKYPIFRVYEYRDKTGIYYCVLTESRDKIDSKGDTTNYKIQALNYKVQNGEWTKTWEINDFIRKGEPYLDENTMWFWTKYVQFEDLDNDGIIEPIIVYGTFALNGYSDGRIKFIINYKGKKYAIRHQNGILDDERNTQIDASFYTLPSSIQQSINATMELMTENEHAIFPYRWQKGMQQKKTELFER